MKIKKIKIENFKGIKELTYSPETKVATLLAKNGTGKTSFIQALECLFGNKHISKSNIRFGEHTAVISADIDEDIFTRQLSKKSKPAYLFNGDAVKEADFRRLMAEKCGIETSDFRVLSTSKLLDDMSSQDLSQFLANHLPEKVSFSFLEKVVKEDISKEAMIILKDALGEEFEPNTLTELYMKFYTERTAVNRESTAAYNKVKEEMDAPKESKEDIIAKKDAIDKKIAEIKAAKDLLAMYAKNKEAYDLAVNRKKSLEEKVAENKCEKPDEKELEKLKESQLEQAAIISRLNASNKVLETNTNLFKKTLDNLDSTICPISEKLICSTDKTALKEELTELINSNNKEVDSNKAEMEKAEKKRVEITSSIEVFHEKMGNYKTYEALEKELKEFKLPDKPKKPSVKVEDEEALMKEKAELNDKYESILLYEAYLKDVKAYEICRLKKKCYDDLVEVANPKGSVIQNIIEAYFAVFNNVLNETAKKLHSPFTLNFVSNDGIYLLCTKDGLDRYYEHLSNGEKIIITFIVLDMLSQLTGNPFLLVDNMNELDNTNLFNFIQLAPELNFEHIFLCGIDYEEIVGAMDFIEHDAVM